jgi:hypothetical protein
MQHNLSEIAAVAIQDRTVYGCCHHLHRSGRLRSFMGFFILLPLRKQMIHALSN